MINFWIGENVVYTIFEANAWRGLTADNFRVVLIFPKKKRRIKSSCYVIICCLFRNLVTIIIAFVPVHVYTLKFWGKKTFYHFSKKRLFSVFLHIEAQLSLKNEWLPQFSLWMSIAPDMIYMSHIVIIWKKILPITEHRP